MTRFPSAPVDHGTASLLDLLAADWTPFAEEDRNRVAWAIRRDAREHGGEVHPNRVRRLIAGIVKPTRVGPVYRALCLQGVIAPNGWDINDGTGVDRANSGNGGKPARLYRWTGGEL